MTEDLTKPILYAARAFVCRVLAWTVILTLGVAVGQQPVSKTTNSNWMTIDLCPVLLDESAEVPAADSGVLEFLNIIPNTPVTKDQVLGRLESSLAIMETKIAKMQHSAALELANDNSNVQYHQAVLEEAREELSNYRSLGKNISRSELTRMELGVKSRDLAYQRSLQEQKQTALDAQLKQTAHEASQARLRNRMISSPIDGVVMNVLRQKGEWVQAGQPVVRIGNLKQLKVDCLVHIRDVDLRRTTGTEVRVTPATLVTESCQLVGQIVSYDPEISSQGNVRLHIRVRNEEVDGHWRLLPGMSVRVELPRADKQQIQGVR